LDDRGKKFGICWGVGGLREGRGVGVEVEIGVEILIGTGTDTKIGIRTRIDRICFCIGRNQEPHEERMCGDSNGRSRSGQGLRFDVDDIKTRSALLCVV
jgi:hypothetical protein